MAGRLVSISAPGISRGCSKAGNAAGLSRLFGRDGKYPFNLTNTPVNARRNIVALEEMPQHDKVGFDFLKVFFGKCLHIISPGGSAFNSQAVSVITPVRQKLMA